ncbi:MAG: protein-L-isoaspartate O-methyltransferase [Beijerinckiaceae bacterium]|jgi:protein-L-isoaspartate(D-aspartate) O-methyltransferase|nr:protein-L-isoaspartate O-methyltransferase [Beijerinckiaceae bacterium]
MNAESHTVQSSDTAQLRLTMVDCQLRTFDVTDHAVLARMTAIPREAFLPSELFPLAYSDRAIDLGVGATQRRLLAPMVLARMVQAAKISKKDTVLCVGGGSGYGAAIVSGLARQVVALESSAALSELAQNGFASLALVNARVVTGDLPAGAPSDAPFDVIIVEGAIETRPENLLAQLASGGRLLTIETQAGAAVSRAYQAVRYEKAVQQEESSGGSASVAGSTRLFSCAGTVLPCFAATREFAF